MTAEQITLGLAEPADAATLAQMARDYVETGLGWSYQPRRIAALIRDADVTALVARDGPRIDGFAIMSFGDERAHLVLLAVQPSRRRRGIARQMLRWLAESAATAGMASIHVELRADNTAAYAMYEAAGFAETFRVPRYYRGRETAVRMLRVLRAPGVTAPGWQPPAASR
jgi:[ribosomal protein S18]-alanine N-acetyltransferase